MIGKTVKTLSAIFNEQAYVEVMPSMTQVSQKDRFTTVESFAHHFQKNLVKETNRENEALRATTIIVNVNIGLGHVRVQWIDSDVVTLFHMSRNGTHDAPT